MEYGTGYYHQHNMKGCALQVCRRSLSENLRSGSSPSAADQAAEEKRRKVADNDRRTHGGGEQIRPREPAMIKALAERYGTRVIESEIVGLTPAKALIDCAEFYLKAKDFDCKKQVMEYHLIDME